MCTSESGAHTGLGNVLGGLPRAPLADSLCPGLTSGCAFGAKKGSVPMRGSRERTRWGFGSGCRSQVMAGMDAMPESRWDFVSQDIGGELVMRRDCPGIGGGGGVRGGGVKAPEGWRSPRPGGLHGGIEHDEHPWAFRREVRETSRSGEGERSATRRRGGRARLAWCLARRDFELDRPEPTVVEIEPGTISSGERCGSIAFITPHTGLVGGARRWSRQVGK